MKSKDCAARASRGDCEGSGPARFEFNFDLKINGKPDFGTAKLKEEESCSED